MHENNHRGERRKLSTWSTRMGENISPYTLKLVCVHVCVPGHIAVCMGAICGGVYVGVFMYVFGG